MNRNISLLSLLVALLLSLPMSAERFYLGGASTAVSISVQKKVSPVVSTALEMFAHDMQALTGRKAQLKSNGVVEVYQLDHLNNKEFKQLQTRKLPLDRFIATPEAYFLGVVGKRLVVAGSDAVGTAYGLMALSELLGVSPWTEIGVATEERRVLYYDEAEPLLGKPSVATRALRLRHAGKHDYAPEDARRLGRLMLRLGLNTLMVNSYSGQPYYSRAMRHAMSDMGVNDITGHDLKNATEVDFSHIAGTSVARVVSSPQPGEVMMAFSQQLASGVKQAMVYTTAYPSVPDFALYCFRNMLNASAAETSSQASSRYQSWLQGLFGQEMGKKTTALMADYHRLAAICAPEALSAADFNAGEFGNELERYIADYRRLARRAESLQAAIPPTQQPLFERLVTFPIEASALMSEMTLQAQEARHIARPGLFYKDDEALTAAANSMTAYNRLLALQQRYDMKLTVQPPALPGKLSAEQVKQYAHNEEVELQPLRAHIGTAVALNAASFASASQGVATIPMLGHSQNALAMRSGQVVTYTFWAKEDNPSVVRVAAIPQAGAQYEVTVDGRAPVVVSVTANENDCLRGQHVATIPMRLTKGRHELKLRAISNRVIIDQWMIDFDTARAFYVFPVSNY